MTSTLTLQILLTIIAAVALAWGMMRFVAMVKADGYGFRSSSGLPRDWAPPDTQSRPYSAKPHF